MKGAIAVLILAVAVSYAFARDPDGRYTNSEFAPWFKQQHNSKGEWCCDESDGHPFHGDYTINSDGSVTLELNGAPHVIPSELVLKGKNPTGHAVWWYRIINGQHRDYCFSPGTLG